MTCKRAPHPSADCRLVTSWVLVLLAVARNPTSEYSDISAAAGREVRQVQRILSGLEEDGFLARRREGRRVHYTVIREAPLGGRFGGTVGDLLDSLAYTSTR